MTAACTCGLMFNSVCSVSVPLVSRVSWSTLTSRSGSLLLVSLLYPLSQIFHTATRVMSHQITPLPCQSKRTSVTEHLLTSRVGSSCSLGEALYPRHVCPWKLSALSTCGTLSCTCSFHLEGPFLLTSRLCSHSPLL